MGRSYPCRAGEQAILHWQFIRSSMYTQAPTLKSFHFLQLSLAIFLDRAWISFHRSLSLSNRRRNVVICFFPFFRFGAGNCPQYDGLRYSPVSTHLGRSVVLGTTDNNRNRRNVTPINSNRTTRNCIKQTSLSIRLRSYIVPHRHWRSLVSSGHRWSYLYDCVVSRYWIWTELPQNPRVSFLGWHKRCWWLPRQFYRKICSTRDGRPLGLLHIIPCYQSHKWCLGECDIV